LPNGVAVFGAAGNQHLRVDRVSTTIGGRQLDGVGHVSLGSEGIATAPPGSDSPADSDLPGWVGAPPRAPRRRRGPRDGERARRRPRLDPAALAGARRRARPARLLLE